MDICNVQVVSNLSLRALTRGIISRFTSISWSTL